MKIYARLLWIVGLINFTVVSNTYAEVVHGRSLYGVPKYPVNFTHFDYVNPNAPKGGTLTTGIVGTFDSLNPFVIKGLPAAGLSMIHPSYLHATLLKISSDEPFSKYGYIAETFEVAADNSWVIFNLRPTAMFHDGSLITADDVIYSYNTLTTQGLPYYRTYYTDVQSVQKINDHSVKFVFKTTTNKELALILGEFPILSQNYYKRVGFEKSNLVSPVGSGPYKIAQVDAGHSIVYERIKGWWGENIPVNKGMYNYDNIRFDYYRDDTVAFEAFKTGATDFRIESIAKNWATGYDNKAVKDGQIIKAEVTTISPEAMIGFMFNTRRDIFKDRRVRQALSYCFDFEWANKNLFYNSYTRSLSYFNKSELAAVGKPTDAELIIIQSFKDQINPELLTSQFMLPETDGSGNIRPQMKQALELLKQAGYEIKNGKLFNTATQQPLTFSFLITNGSAVERLIQGFVNNLNKLGAIVDIKVVDVSQYVSRIQDFDFDMIFSGVNNSISPGNEQREFWQSDRADIKGSQNYTGVKDPVIDVLIDKIVNALSRAELVNLTKILDRVLLQGFYMVPGYYSASHRIAYNSKLKRPQSSSLYYPDFNTWWIEAPL